MNVSQQLISFVKRALPATTARSSLHKVCQVFAFSALILAGSSMRKELPNKHQNTAQQGHCAMSAPCLQCVNTDWPVVHLSIQRSGSAFLIGHSQGSPEAASCTI